MTKSQIKAELWRIAVEESYPIGHMLLRNRSCFEEILKFKTFHQNLLGMSRLHLRIFMLFVSEAL